MRTAIVVTAFSAVAAVGLAAGWQSGAGSSDPHRGLGVGQHQPRVSASPAQPLPQAGPAVAGVVASLRRPWSTAVVGGYAYSMPSSQDAFAFPHGAADGGLESGVASLAMPLWNRSRAPSEPSTHFAVANLAQPEGFTDFVMYVYDQSRLVDYVCQKLNEDMTEYVDPAWWGYIPSGFVGSSIVSASFWTHDVADGAGTPVRRNVGLAAVADYWAAQPGESGDEAFASVGAPLLGSPQGYSDWPWERPPECRSEPGRPPVRPTTQLPWVVAAQLTAAGMTRERATSPDQPPSEPYAGGASRVLLPALAGAPGLGCATDIVIQNVGSRAGRAVVVTWADGSECDEACRGPLGFVCTGLIAPGTTWRVPAADVGTDANSAEVFSFDPEGLVAAAPCSDPEGCPCEFETLFGAIVGDCTRYGQFQTAYLIGGAYAGVEMSGLLGPQLVATAIRTCTDPAVADAPPLREGYLGIAAPWLGASVGEDWTYDLPLLSGPGAPEPSAVRVQNASAACANVELWFTAANGCEPALCDVAQVAPGASYRFEVGACDGDVSTGAGVVRSDAPAAVVADTVLEGALLSYTGVPRSIRDPNGEPLFAETSAVAFAPLVYGRHEGWTSALHLQNSGDVEAVFRVTLTDRAGSWSTSRQLGPVCRGASVVFDLAEVGDLPGCWVGSARVEALPARAAPVSTPWAGPEPTQVSDCDLLPTPTPSPTATSSRPSSSLFLPRLAAPARGGESLSGRPRTQLRWP